MLGKAVGYQPTGVEMSKGKPGRRFGACKAVGCQPTGVETSKGRSRVSRLVLGKAVGYQPTKRRNTSCESKMMPRENLERKTLT